MEDSDLGDDQRPSSLPTIDSLDPGKEDSFRDDGESPADEGDYTGGVDETDATEEPPADAPHWGGPCDDGDDSMQDATFLPIGAADGEICAAEDEDYFAFYLPNRADVTIQLSFSARSGDLDLRLLNSEGTTLQASTSVDDDERIAATLPAGEYFVHVYGFNGAVNEYILTILGLGMTEPAPPIDESDEHDGDDSMEFSNFIDFGTSAEGSISHADDRDYYLVDIGSYSVTLNLGCERCDVAFDVVTTRGDVFARGQWRDGALRADIHSEAPLLILVYSPTGDTGEYRLSVE